MGRVDAAVAAAGMLGMAGDRPVAALDDDLGAGGDRRGASRG